MLTVNVNLASHAYPIHIGADLLDRTELFAPHLIGSTVALITNTTLEPLYAVRLKSALAPLGKELIQIVLPDGEAHKNWETLNLIFTQLLAAHADRKTTLIALGGGVIGDITGFAAACYMRGVPFIQVPTTLLAQVDSSVGGKTGINHPLGKNMIGAFHQPQVVIADTALLRTLPARELAAGLAEIIKAGAIADAAFFDWIETHIAALNDGDEGVIAEAIHRACRIKAEVVGADEREQGMRALLNFGHTFGHAIEAGLGYGVWLHGEAVGCGIVMAATLSQQLGLIDNGTQMRVKRLIAAAHLPTQAPALGSERYLELMRVDKKAEAGQINCILLKRLGAAFVKRVADHHLRAMFAA